MARRRRVVSAATRAKLSKAMKGKKHPHRGHPMSAATRSKISKALKGRHHKTVKRRKKSTHPKARKHKVTRPKSTHPKVARPKAHKAKPSRIPKTLKPTKTAIPKTVTASTRATVNASAKPIGASTRRAAAARRADASTRFGKKTTPQIKASRVKTVRWGQKIREHHIGQKRLRIRASQVGVHQGSGVFGRRVRAIRFGQRRH